MSKPLVVVLFENHFDLSMPSLLHDFQDEGYLAKEFKNFYAETPAGASLSSLRNELFAIEDRGDTNFMLQGVHLNLNTDYDDQAFLKRLGLEGLELKKKNRLLMAKNTVLHNHLFRTFLEKLASTPLGFKAIDWDEKTREEFQVLLKGIDQERSREKRELIYDKYLTYNMAYRDPLMARAYLKAEEDTIGFNGGDHIPGIQQQMAAEAKTEEDKARFVFIRVTSDPEKLEVVHPEPGQGTKTCPFGVYTVDASPGKRAEAIQRIKGIIAERRAALEKMAKVGDSQEFKTEDRDGYIAARFYHRGDQASTTTTTTPAAGVEPVWDKGFLQGML